ncbi:pupal cuticle protein Edg-91 [Drosophila virilis]|uniref:Uncharacterized protein n=1 Tax=Drosophila virilis TaxID=7244 RepID=B4LWY1_DROVI|nr:prisilkin-39 [Drosophila virilis]EDW67728.2 uncharacterized protein Dvir_GJ24316 [Drosophila virilis]
MARTQTIRTEQEPEPEPEAETDNMRVPCIMFLSLLLGNCLDLGNALFFNALKGLKGSAGSGYRGYNYGYGGYSANYGSNYNGGYGGYGDGYAGYDGYGYGYGYGYPQQPNRTRNRQRTGRTYSEIANVLRPDPYLGLGAGRYLPRAPYSHLWG